MIFLWCIGVFFLALVIFHFVTRKLLRRGRLLSKIAGPPAYPIVGNALTFNLCTMHEFWTIGRGYMKQYYPITRFWLLHSAMISAAHPDDMEILLTSQKVIQKGYVYDYLQPWLKTGLLTSTSDKWRQRRKILTPAFHFGILKKYLDVTNEQGKKFIAALKSEGDETVKSLIPFCSDYTLNIICESIMGVALDKMEQNIVTEYKQAIHNMGEIVLYRISRPYIVDWMLPFIPRIGSMHRNALKVLHDFTKKVISERREFHKSTGDKYLIEFTDDSEETVYHDYQIGGRKKRLAMLDLLLVAEKRGLIDSEGVQEEVDTFAFEGHDTSSMSLTFTLLLLAENKEIQDRLRTEITEMLDKNGGEFAASDIQGLNYLDRCLKESLRLLPPVATLMRYTKDELQLKNALIPADSHILIHFWDTHRDANFWPNPDKFDPDRFLPENCKDRHPFAYIPFSAGPRNCIGQKFALMELKILLSRILYDFYLEPIDFTKDMRLMADIILRPVDPVHLKFVRIHR